MEGIMAHFEKWIQGPKGKTLLASCKLHGINVEYEVHAVKELLPRSLFDKNPSMFLSADGR